MSSRKLTNQIVLLAASLAGHRAKLIRLFGKLTDLGALQNMTPRIFGRFMHMLDQIAEEKEKEMQVISLIEAVERQHDHNRHTHQLAKAGHSGSILKPTILTFNDRKTTKLKTNPWLYLLMFSNTFKKQA